MTTRTKAIGIMGFTFAIGVVGRDASATCPSAPTNYTCACNSGDTKRVCARWTSAVAPVLNSDFYVAYTGDIPEVKFATADSGWEVYSEVISGGAAADLGAVLLAADVSPNDGDFGVKINKPSGFGANNVSAIVLDSAESAWTGGSNLVGGTPEDPAYMLTVIGGITIVEDSNGN